ncbi:unnamed protein product [Thlaspi arvense]|uniref:Uncharacterized protein n=1 Tax=Thlaspi arvense TaxID=13288 RepID=A0AAU9SRK8_THLAR|nr:unnamed protein product [Thlaspi arvense]
MTGVTAPSFVQSLLSLTTLRTFQFKDGIVSSTTSECEVTLMPLRPVWVARNSSFVQSVNSLTPSL